MPPHREAEGHLDDRLGDALAGRPRPRPTDRALAGVVAGAAVVVGACGQADDPPEPADGHGVPRAFVAIPTRRNRVWQTDFFELETSGGGTWRSGDVIDYAPKLVLAEPVTATLLGHALLDDVTDSQTGEVTAVIVVSDNGPCYKSSGFARYIDSRRELTHVRTRRRSPQTNGVTERYHGAIQIEHLWRQLPADGAQMTEIVQDFRQLYNTIRLDLPRFRGVRLMLS